MKYYKVIHNDAMYPEDVVEWRTNDIPVPEIYIKPEEVKHFLAGKGSCNSIAYSSNDHIIVDVTDKSSITITRNENGKRNYEEIKVNNENAEGICRKLLTKLFGNNFSKYYRKGWPYVEA